MEREKCQNKTSLGIYTMSMMLLYEEINEHIDRGNLLDYVIQNKERITNTITMKQPLQEQEKEEIAKKFMESNTVKKKIAELSDIVKKLYEQ